MGHLRLLGHAGGGNIEVPGRRRIASYKQAKAARPCTRPLFGSSRSGKTLSMAADLQARKERQTRQCRDVPRRKPEPFLLTGGNGSPRDPRCQGTFLFCSGGDTSTLPRRAPVAAYPGFHGGRRQRRGGRRLFRIQLLEGLHENPVSRPQWGRRAAEQPPRRTTLLRSGQGVAPARQLKIRRHASSTTAAGSIVNRGRAAHRPTRPWACPGIDSIAQGPPLTLTSRIERSVSSCLTRVRLLPESTETASKAILSHR